LIKNPCSVARPPTARRFVAKARQHAPADPIFRGCHPETLLERAVEGPDRTVAAIQRYRQNRQAFGAQARSRFGEPVVVQEVIEIAVAEFVVDERAQHRFAQAQCLRQGSQRQAVLVIELVLGHGPLQARQLGPCLGLDDRRGCRRRRREGCFGVPRLCFGDAQHMG
jgi:hypothetical protein